MLNSDSPLQYLDNSFIYLKNNEKTKGVLCNSILLSKFANPNIYKKMKQLKFLMVAFTLLMGVSLTSCLDNGDDNPIKEMSAIVKYEGSMYGGVFKMIDGSELEPSDVVQTIDLVSGKMYAIYFSYNINDVVANKATKITLLATPSNISGPEVVASEYASTANAPLYALDYNEGYYNYYPYMFYKHTMIFYALFWLKDVTSKDDLAEEIKKHRFEISYDAVEGGVLNLYVNHLIDEEKETERTKYTVNTYAYDLQPIIDEVANEGSTINKIIVHAKVNSSKNSLENAMDKTYEIDYSKLNN